MMTRFRWSTLLVLALAAACSGGTPSSSLVDSASQSSVSGTVSGLTSPSLVVDGATYDATAASVVKDTDPANPTPATFDDLELGQQVILSLGGGKIHEAFIEATVVGTIDKGSINPNDTGTTNTVASSFTVLGQTVVFTPSGSGATVFDGITGSSELADGQIVEVYGTLGAGGTVLATRIDVLPSTGTTVVRVEGIVASTDATAHTFLLGNLTVDYSSATLVPSTASISNGEKVFVYSDEQPTGTAPNLTLAAKSIRVENATVATQPVRVDGLVTSVTPVTDQTIPNFTVDGFSVDDSKATLTGGATASELTVNALVRVDGTLSNNTIVASSIAIVPVSSGRAVLLFGQVSSFTSLSSFVVAGTTVDASQATFVNGKASDLVNGAFVLVQGTLSASAVVADRITFETPPQNVTFRLVGTVSNYDASAMPPTFTLLDIAMELDPSVVFPNGTASQFVNGVVVEVTGKFTGNVFDVTSVVFEGEPLPVESLTGTIAGLTASPITFVLNNATVTVTASTEIRNGPLADGQVVEVTAELNTTTGALVAESIVVLSRDSVQLFGPITSFTSASNFTVDNETVDASSATFLPPSTSASDLAVGKVVRIDGSLSNGVVQADTVVFLFQFGH
jgi:hypothetical protein